VFALGIIQKVRNGRGWRCFCLFRDKLLQKFQWGGVSSWLYYV